MMIIASIMIIIIIVNGIGKAIRINLIYVTYLYELQRKIQEI